SRDRSVDGTAAVNPGRGQAEGDVRPRADDRRRAGAVRLPRRATHSRWRAWRSRELPAGGARSLHAVERRSALPDAAACESTPMSMLANALDARQGPRT